MSSLAFSLLLPRKMKKETGILISLNLFSSHFICFEEKKNIKLYLEAARTPQRNCSDCLAAISQPFNVFSATRLPITTNFFNDSHDAPMHSLHYICSKWFFEQQQRQRLTHSRQMSADAEMHIACCG